MSDDRAGADDEPLDGDIGPAPGVGAGNAGAGARTGEARTGGADAGDEPLDGDIGPAAGRGAARPSGGPRGDAAAELRRYEAEREARRRATNAVSGRIAVVAAALLLAFLTFDSARTALAAHAKGDDWVYPPAVIAAICGGALLTLVTWVLKRVK